jgi:hypothetical protein
MNVESFNFGLREHIPEGDYAIGEWNNAGGLAAVVHFYDDARNKYIWYDKDSFPNSWVCAGFSSPVNIEKCIKTVSGGKLIYDIQLHPVFCGLKIANSAPFRAFRLIKDGFNENPYDWKMKMSSTKDSDNYDIGMYIKRMLSGDSFEFVDSKKNEEAEIRFRGRKFNESKFPVIADIIKKYPLDLNVTIHIGYGYSINGCTN